jgi:hypothetical protein
MSEAPVWGTFSVRDHLRPEAFLREVLLFDRLVVPYPDPEVPGEWQRWRRPEPGKPSVTWNPGRLDQILKVVGTESEVGYNGARLAQRSMWSPYTWQVVKSNLDIAEMASGNPWYATALGIREGLPEVVEAVAAYGSERAWRAEVKPKPTPDADPQDTDAAPQDISVTEALVQLARPLLVPSVEGKEMDKLRAAVDLALDDDFRKARHAYFTWFRDFLEPLRSDDPDQVIESLSPASVVVMQDRLRQLYSQEVAAAKRVDRNKWGSRVETGCVTASALGAIGLAALASLPVLGVAVGVLSLGGWAAKRLTEPKAPRALSGASMFVDAQRRLSWLPAS